MDTPTQSGNLIARQYAQFKWFEFRFSGKISRQEYFEENALLSFLMLISAILSCIYIGLPVLLLVMIHMIGLAVRRLRDTGRSWAYIFIGLIPLVGTPILLYITMDDSVTVTDGETKLPPAPAPAPAPESASVSTICSLCNGSGLNAAGHTCPKCSGKGVN